MTYAVVTTSIRRPFDCLSKVIKVRVTCPLAAVTLTKTDRRMVELQSNPSHMVVVTSARKSFSAATVNSFKARLDSWQMKKLTITIKPTYHAPEVEVIMTLI